MNRSPRLSSYLKWPAAGISALRQTNAGNRLLMRRIATVLIPFCLIAFSNISTYNAHQNFRTTNDTVIGMLEYLPEDYHENSDKYPLVIFLHGIIEKGINSTDPAILESTIFPVDNLGPPKHVREGHEFPFILISPQLKHEHETWPGWYIVEVVEWAKANLRVDEKRIHITGLSLGGGGAFGAIQDHPSLFASAAPICANTNSPSHACSIAEDDLGVWAFHGLGDPEVPFTTTSDMIEAIRKCTSGTSPNTRLTIYNDLKHNVWDRAYLPDHTYHSENLYDWMMSTYNIKNGTNYLPSANAGPDRVYSEAKPVTLHGTGSDRDGNIVSYKWVKQSGPLAKIAPGSNGSATAYLTHDGEYIFKLTVTDNAGDTDSDFVRVTIGAKYDYKVARVSRTPIPTSR